MTKIYAVAYLASAAALVGLDALWIFWIARRFYASALGPLLRERPNLGAALIFYVVYLVGIVVFAVMPALGNGVAKATLLGALYGLCAYATYDLTNLATLRCFPARLAILDLAWGICVTAASATAGFHAAQWVAGRGAAMTGGPGPSSVARGASAPSSSPALLNLWTMRYGE